MSFSANRIIFFLLSLPLFNFPTSLLSQQSISSSYIITLEGDTLYGNFDLISLTENPEKVGFKTDLESSFTFYDPTQIRGFSLNTQERYVSRKVDINTSPITIEKISTDTKEPVFRTDIVFLQVLVEGKAGLYGLLDKGRWHYFIEKKEIPLEELILTRYISYREGEKVSTYEERYKRRLRNLFSDSKEIFALVPLIDRARYQEKDLIKLVSFYNGSVKDLRFSLESNSKNTLTFGVLGGVSGNTINLTLGTSSSIPQVFEQQSYSLTPSFQLGVYLKQNLRSNKNLLHHELIYRNFRISKNLSSSSNGTPSQDEIKVNLSYLDINNLVRTRVSGNQSNHSYFLELGLPISLLLQENISWSRTTSTGSTVLENNGSSDERLRQFEVGAIGGIGFAKNRISLVTRYRFGTGFSKRNNGRSFTQTISLLAAYDLK